jgi:hypothetical protein
MQTCGPLRYERTSRSLLSTRATRKCAGVHFDCLPVGARLQSGQAVALVTETSISGDALDCAGTVHDASPQVERCRQCRRFASSLWRLHSAQSIALGWASVAAESVSPVTCRGIDSTCGNHPNAVVRCVRNTKVTPGNPRLVRWETVVPIRLPVLRPGRHHIGHFQPHQAGQIGRVNVPESSAVNAAGS